MSLCLFAISISMKFQCFVKFCNTFFIIFYNYKVSLYPQRIFESDPRYFKTAYFGDEQIVSFPQITYRTRSGWS